MIEDRNLDVEIQVDGGVKLDNLKGFLIFAGTGLQKKRCTLVLNRQGKRNYH